LLSHEYRLPGVYQLRVSVTDAPGGGALTAGGLAAPSAALELVVLQRDSCYRFTISWADAPADAPSQLLFAVAPLATRSLLVRVSDSAALAHGFASLGVTPSLVFANDTLALAGAVRFDASRGGWVVPLRAGPYPLATTLTVRAPPVNLLGCTVADTSLSVLVAAASPPAATLSAAQLGAVNLTRTRFAQGACRRALAVVSFGDGAVAWSEVLFAEHAATRLWRLNASRVDAVAVLSDALAAATDRGVLLSSSLSAPNGSLSWHVAPIGDADVDSGTWAATAGASLELSLASDACPPLTQERPREALLLSLLASNGSRVHWLSLDAHHEHWVRLSLPAGAVRVVSVAADLEARGVVFALAEDGAGRARLFRATVDPASDELGAWSERFAFPAWVDDVAAMTLRVGGDRAVLFAAGATLWASESGGERFRLLSAAPPGDAPLRVATGPHDATVAMLSRRGAVLLNRNLALGAVSARALVAPTSAPRTAAAEFPAFDALGRLLLVTVRRTGDVGAHALPTESAAAAGAALAEGFLINAAATLVPAPVSGEEAQISAPLLGHLPSVAALAGGAALRLDGRMLGAVRVASNNLIVRVAEGPLSLAATLACRSNTAVLCPATAAPLRAVPGAANATTLMLTLPPATEGWLASDTGKTVAVALPGAVEGAARWLFRITRVVNASAADAQLELGGALPSSATTQLAAAGAWSLLDTRGWAAAPPVGLQTLAVSNTSSGGASVALDLSAATPFAWRAEHVGWVLAALEDGAWGIVEVVTNATRAIVRRASAKPFASPVLASSQWQLYQARPGAPWPEMGNSTQAAVRRAALVVPPCPYEALQLHGADEARTAYLDVGDEARLQLSLREPTDDAKALVFKLALSQPNATLVSRSSLATLSATGTERLLSTNLTLSRGAHRRAGEVLQSDLLIAPSHQALACSVGLLRVHVVLGCPPSKRIVLEGELSPEAVADPERHGVTFEGGAPFEPLPINYRPPSPLGERVPLGAHIYNAHPAYPRFADYMPMSQRSGAFQQCARSGSAEASDSNPCGCTSDQRVSALARDSDCAQKALRIAYVDALALRFQTLERGRESRQLRGRALLTELNNRTEFCVGDTMCTSSGVSQLEIDLDAAPRLVWRGAELFHFRVTPLEAYTDCELAAEFKRYVVFAPLNRRVSGLVLSLSAVAIGLVILAGFAHQQRREFRTVKPLR
jgi:hypothetical protein